MSDLLSEKSLLKRLYTGKLDSDQELKGAESILWELNHKEGNSYQIITSDYWLNRNDIDHEEFSGKLRHNEINHFS